MKKLVIAGASVALAAMPVLGAFAATSSSFTDTLTVGVAGGCTLENSNQSSAGDYSVSDRTFTTDIATGTVGYLNADATGVASTTAGTVTVSCNTQDSSKTWQVSLNVTDLADGANSITGGAQTSGATSGWAIKSNATGTTTANPFGSAYTAAADTTIFLSATANNTVTFNPSYQVYVGPNQAPGTYTGTAVYEVTLP
ncbi:hypothetical protein IKE13_02305 [Candidatus Saccharibacteria bacterium]|nr:hypothetical protein [Candidatus Saccharibacteria bacterium]